MGLLSCDERFSLGVRDIVTRLQDTPYAEDARKTLDDANKFGDHGTIMQIFRNFGIALGRSGQEIPQRISKELLAMVEKESHRMREVFQERLFGKKHDLESEVIEPPRKRAKIDTSQDQSMRTVEQIHESADGVGSSEQPLLEVLDNQPLDVLVEIVSCLSDTHKESLFQAILKSKQALHLREALIIEGMRNMPSVNQELCDLYRLTFDRPITPIQETFQERKAQEKAEKFGEVAILDQRLFRSIQRLKKLPAEFEALPQDRREMFKKSDGSQIQSSDILKNPLLCKQVIKNVFDIRKQDFLRWSNSIINIFSSSDWPYEP